MIITTERLVLRPITEEDADDIFEYSKNENVGRNAGWEPHRGINDTLEFIKIFGGEDKDSFGIELKENGRIIGSVGIIDDPKREFDGARMLGYSMSEDYWNKGIMTEAVAAVVKYGFSKPQVKLISAYCYPENKRSRRVLEKCGFSYEGTLTLCEKIYTGEVLDNDCFVLTRGK